MRRVLVIFVFLGAALGSGRAQLMDRIAVTVGTDVFTESEVMEQVRLTALLNHQAPDESAEARRRAADRLVDQDLIRREMADSHFTPPPESDARQMLEQFKRSRFAGDAAYRQALARYQVTEDQLQALFLWQLTALRFTDLRFGGGAVSASGEAARSERDPAIEVDVDRALDAWLQQARQRARIRFREEAFE